VNKRSGNAPLAWMLLLAFVFLSLRGLERPAAVVDRAGEPLPVERVAPEGPGADFAAPPESRRITLANGLRIHEGHVAAALGAGNRKAPTWSAFAWLFDRQVVATVAPGFDQRHHFASAFLVGYVPFPNVDAWVPLVALAQSKAYEFDHDQFPGRGEIWQTSREAFYYPTGDCEDHAIALADWLIGLGHDARVVIGRLKGEGHAWVVLHAGDQTYLLEATNKRPAQALPLASRHPEYQPEAMFNRETYWVNAGPVLTTDYRSPHWQERSTFTRTAAKTGSDQLPAGS